MPDKTFEDVYKTSAEDDGTKRRVSLSLGTEIRILSYVINVCDVRDAILQYKNEFHVSCFIMPRTRPLLFASTNKYQIQILTDVFCL